jgi:MFS family permease
MMRRRAWIALLIFTAVIINYMDRVVLSVAAKPIAAEFGFSPVEMGYLFSGFLWTYVVCLIPLGLLVERVGAKRMVGGGIAVWSVATAVTAATAGFASILAARLIMGASEATTFPGMRTGDPGLVSAAGARPGDHALQWWLFRRASHRCAGCGSTCQSV